MKILPKYKQIARSLMEKIKSGEYKKNSFLPSENSLTKIYNCSRITIRQALSILIRKNVIKTIHGVGSVIIKSPEEIVFEDEDFLFIDKDEPLSRELQRIGLLYSKSIKWGIENPFYGEIISSIEKNAKEAGYLLSFAIYEDMKRISDVSEFIVDNNVVGFILLGDIERKVVEILKNTGLPLVSVNSPVVENYKISIVINDDYRGGYEVGKFLLSIGCERIACIKAPKNVSSCDIRFEGFLEGLKKNGYNTSNLIVVEGNLEFDSGYECVKKFFSFHKQVPDGIFCLNDLMAIGAMKYITEQGLRIPDNINVIGFDNIAQSAQVFPSLTTVEIQRKKMGEIAVRKLIYHIHNINKLFSLKVVLPCKLVVRNSTRNINS